MYNATSISYLVATTIDLPCTGRKPVNSNIEGILSLCKEREEDHDVGEVVRHFDVGVHAAILR